MLRELKMRVKRLAMARQMPLVMKKRLRVTMRRPKVRQLRKTLRSTERKKVPRVMMLRRPMMLRIKTWTSRTERTDPSRTQQRTERCL